MLRVTDFHLILAILTTTITFPGVTTTLAIPEDHDFLFERVAKAFAQAYAVLMAMSYILSFLVIGQGALMLQTLAIIPNSSSSNLFQHIASQHRPLALKLFLTWYAMALAQSFASIAVHGWAGIACLVIIAAGGIIVGVWIARWNRSLTEMLGVHTLVEATHLKGSHWAKPRSEK